MIITIDQHNYKVGRIKHESTPIRCIKPKKGRHIKPKTNLRSGKEDFTEQQGRRNPRREKRKELLKRKENPKFT